MKESMPTEYYPRKLTNLPKEKRKDQHTHKNQDLMIKLFTPYELFVRLVNIIENILESMIGNIFKSNFKADLWFLPK